MEADTASETADRQPETPHNANMKRFFVWGTSRAVALLLTAGLVVTACGDGYPDGEDANVESTDRLIHWPGFQSDDPSGSASKFFVVHMTPGPDSRTATPRSEIRFRFSRAIEPDTVDEQTVVLRERESLRTVPVRVHVHGVHMTVTPLRPLNTNYRYTIDLGGVGSQSGHTTDFAARFFTVPNHPVLYLRYTGTEATRAHEFSWDADAGYLGIDHKLPGPDGVLQTADDPQDVLAEVFYDAEQDNTHSHVRTNPGPDGVFDTADDFHTYERTMTYSAAGMTTRYHEYFGSDGEIGTPDDYTGPLETHYYDAEDRFVGLCNGTSCTRLDYFDGERAALVLSDPGPDGIWRTDDDELGNDWIRNVYDENGVELGSEFHVLTSGGTPTPSAATLTGYADMTVVDGLATEVRIYDGAGADGVWRTADDAASVLVAITYDEDGLRQTMFNYEAGPDDQFGTVDDRLADEWFY